MSNQQLPTTDQQRDLGIIIMKDLKWQKQKKSAKRPTEHWVHCLQFQLQKQRIDPPIIKIPCPSTSRTLVQILLIK